MIGEVSGTECSCTKIGSGRAAVCVELRTTSCLIQLFVLLSVPINIVAAGVSPSTASSLQSVNS